jgi:hypothetical protein
MKKLVSFALVVSIAVICLLSAVASQDNQQKQSPLFKSSLKWSIDKIEHKFQNLAMENTFATTSVKCIKTNSTVPESMLTIKNCISNLKVNEE